MRRACGHMSNLYLDSGETIILTTPGVSFNAVLYDMMLTTRRLILVDSAYTRFEPQMIPLTTILSVTAGKVASGEPVITLTLTDTGSTGNVQQMNLIFSQQPGEQRKRERDEWLRNLMGHIISARDQTLSADIPPSPAGQEPGIRPAGAIPRPIEMALPRKLIIETPPDQEEPVILPDQPELSVVPEEEPELAATITPSAPAVEELPFIPKEEPESPDAVTPVAPAVEEATAIADETSGSFHLFTVAAWAVRGSVVAPEEKIGSRETAPPAAPAGEKRPFVPEEEPGSAILLAPAPVEEPTAFLQEEPHPSDTALPPPPFARAAGQPPAKEAPPRVPQSPSPPPQKPRSGRHTVIAVTALIIIILVMAGGMFLLSHYVPSTNEEFPAPGVTLVPAIPPVIPIPTIQLVIPTPTIQPTPAPPGIIIPQDGVWVRVTYNGTFVGWVGNPGFLKNVRGSIDQFYKILKSTSLVEASFQKQDNSGETLAVEVYRNGEMIERRTVRAPMGEIAFIINPKTSNPIGAFPVITSSGQ
jgi:hypothetical protein